MEIRRMDPMRNGLDFLYRIKDTVNEINHRIKKKKLFDNWQMKVSTLVARTKEQEVDARRHSILLSYFGAHGDHDTSRVKNHHYSDVKKQTRRRSSLFGGPKKFDNFQVNAKGVATIGGIKSKKKNMDANSRAGGMKGKDSKRERKVGPGSGKSSKTAKIGNPYRDR